MADPSSKLKPIFLIVPHSLEKGKMTQVQPVDIEKKALMLDMAHFNHFSVAGFHKFNMVNLPPVSCIL